MKIDLSISHEQSYPSILGRWQWFRQTLMELYNLKTLPETFTEDDGEFSINEGIPKDGIRYDMVPPEINYNWHCQELTFNEGQHQVKVTINRDDLYSYYRFNYQGDTKESKVRFFISFREQSLTLDDESPHKEIWERACALLGTVKK